MFKIKARRQRAAVKEITTKRGGGAFVTKRATFARLARRALFDVVTFEKFLYVHKFKFEFRGKDNILS